MLYSYLNQQVNLVNKEKERKEEEEDKEEQRAALAYWLFNRKEIKEDAIKIHSLDDHFYGDRSLKKSLGERIRTST